MSGTSLNGSLKSNSTSENSLFSLNKKVYSNLLLQKSSYYYANDEIDENNESDVPLPHGLSLNNLSTEHLPTLSRVNSHSPSPLTFKSTRDYSRLMNESTVKDSKFVFVLVGLPAVGKSAVSSQLIQFLRNNPATHSLRCTSFNAGKVRRKMSYRNLGMRSMQLANNSSDDLFSPKNTEKKEKYARITLDKLIKELDSDICDVAIFDATNSQVQRRKFVFSEISSYNQDIHSNFSIIPIVLQITCDDQSFVKFNIHNKTFNEDYFDKPYHYAIADFARRLKNYCSQFTPFSKNEFALLVDSFDTKGLNSGLFAYNIINSGLVSTTSINSRHLPANCSDKVMEMIMLAEYFVEHYASLFGSSYIERVKDFFSEQKQNHLKLGSLDYFSSLSAVLDENYFIELQEILEKNLGK
ncbi:hypothetical protein HG535_0F01960 [Zygotorulaspora mrakii]|uniref:6-phosphofructo-2-kinase domain-containing protein n=1 Tax=Zygotorulaspora mrakii TaxID=42260 RepID=A0A7H9B4T1_ZYGMR|nr:uncharacterized protein HG535_0F01960 [Zygotorulaspora mrakii]QLG73685.1 hypothetical protein HG535_0F01960 [Zygotorulaspora mrakii]